MVTNVTTFVTQHNTNGQWSNGSSVIFSVFLWKKYIFKTSQQATSAGIILHYISAFIHRIRAAFCFVLVWHYGDVIIGAMGSQISSLTIIYSTVYSGADQRTHQSSASLAFVRGIHRWPVNSPHKGPVTWIMFPFDDVIMLCRIYP